MGAFLFELLIGQDGKVKVHRMPNQLLLLFLLDAYEIVFADRRWNLVVLVKTIGSREFKSCLFAAGMLSCVEVGKGILNGVKI